MPSQVMAASRNPFRFFRPIERVTLTGLLLSIFYAWLFGRRYYFIFAETVRIAALPLLWFVPSLLGGHLLRVARCKPAKIRLFHLIYLGSLMPLFFGGVALQMIFGIRSVPGMAELMPILYAVNLGLAAGCAIATSLACRRRRAETLRLLHREALRAARILRCALCLLLCLIAYSNLKTMIPLVRPGLNDDLLHVIDRAIFFGGHPFRWMNSLSIRGLPELMVQSYLCFFFLLIYGPIGAILFGSARRLERVVAAYIAAYFIGAAAYLLIPAVGPAFASDTARTFAPTSAFQIKTALLSMYRGFLLDPQHAPVFPFEGLASFPSLHVTIALLSLYYLRGVERRLAALLMIPFILLTISTLYLGMHHFLDLPAGVAVAALSVAAVKRLYPVPAPAFRPAQIDPRPAPIEKPAFD